MCIFQLPTIKTLRIYPHRNVLTIIVHQKTQNEEGRMQNVETTISLHSPFLILHSPFSFICPIVHLCQGAPSRP
jgi:3-hydroxymyristoyl/3-hydroxydecanoyl-(acyl carrier protein) dehydratase